MASGASNGFLAALHPQTVCFVLGWGITEEGGGQVSQLRHGIKVGPDWVRDHKAAREQASWSTVDC